jgi:predicted GNAT family acetyltransferase
MALITSNDAAGFLPHVQGAGAAHAQQTALTLNSLQVRPLAAEDEAEVLGFLQQRPLHTVVMSSFIRDHGLVSPLNRGAFYAYRNRVGRLEGVALIGHTLLFEAQTAAAVSAFARLAQDCPQPYLLMGEREQVARFWQHYAPAGALPRLLHPTHFLELNTPYTACEPVAGLRPATLDETEAMMTIQAEMVFEESGANPMESDIEGFRGRCMRRIERGRVWTLMQDGRPIFKADVIAETPETAYLEGVYVSPQERGKGYGRRCLSQLGRILLARTKSVCLFVDALDAKNQSFYRSVGYTFHSHYDLLYF